MELIIDQIPVTVIRKQIKHMHLYVKAPDGRVEVTAPMRMSTAVITEFVHSKNHWIREKQAEIVSRPRPEKRQYRSGESLYLWGERYELQVFGGGKYSLTIKDQTAYFTVCAGSTAQQREHYVKEWYREVLKERIAERLPVIEEQTGLHCSGWQTKDMTTRWGTCNTTTKKIWLSLWLVKRPLICLDYVILHELVHTKIRNHGADFAAMMSYYMPNWKEIRILLNTEL